MPPARLQAIAALFSSVFALGLAAGPAPLIAVRPDGSSLLQNDRITVGIDPQGDIASLGRPGGPNLVERGYMTGPYLRGSSRRRFRLVRDTAGIGEVAYAFRAHNLDIDLHYAILPGVSGIYCYLELEHDPARGSPSDALGFFKHVLQADPKSFTFLQSTDTEQGFAPPRSAVRRVIGNPSDHTYQLDPAKFDNVYCRGYYSKYDYMQYAREHAVYGLYSPATGTGLYVIHGGLDWTPGGPTKSLQTVHDPAIINTIINDQHMLQNFFQVNRFPGGATWRKLAGPFLIYLNRSPSPAKAWADAKAEARAEEGAWPYRWVRDPDYPLSRSAVRGRLAVAGGSPAGAWCVLADPGSDWQDQCLAYIYWTRAVPDGSFEFGNVRPGTYSLYAFSGGGAPRGGNPFNDYKSPPFRVPAVRAFVNLGSLSWTAESHGGKLFQIGIPDRSTRGFEFGDLRRQYGLWKKVPARLDYVAPPPSADAAEQSAYEAEHWPCLESEDGSDWRIHFACDRAPRSGAKAWLTLALAGTCKKPVLQVLANGREIWRSGARWANPDVAFGDDASVRRCAINGAYHHYLVIPFDATLLRPGPGNVLDLRVTIPGRNKDAGGIMYDALKLELGPD